MLFWCRLKVSPFINYGTVSDVSTHYCLIFSEFYNLELAACMDIVLAFVQRSFSLVSFLTQEVKIKSASQMHGLYGLLGKNDMFHTNTKPQ